MNFLLFIVFQYKNSMERLNTIRNNVIGKKLITIN